MCRIISFCRESFNLPFTEGFLGHHSSLDLLKCQKGLNPQDKTVKRKEKVVTDIGAPLNAVIVLYTVTAYTS